MTRSEPHETVAHELGFRRLSPLPDEAALRDFYGDEYYDGLDDEPRRGPDIARLQAGGDAAETERGWLEATLYEDVRHYLGNLGHNDGLLLDVGCGTGDFLASMRSAGWEVEGTELSKAAASTCADVGLRVSRVELQQLSAPADTFDVITMFNVLEHVRDPIGDLQAAHALLRPGGCLVIQVPNDFSLLQQAGVEYQGMQPWWIAVPDHLNYFDYPSLHATLRHAGFEPRVTSGSFPMELFLLLGENYVEDPAAGSRAHAQRCDLELSLTGPTRRALAEALASASIGRNCLVISVRT